MGYQKKHGSTEETRWSGGFRDFVPEYGRGMGDRKVGRKGK